MSPLKISKSPEGKYKVTAGVKKDRTEDQKRHTTPGLKSSEVKNSQPETVSSPEVTTTSPDVSLVTSQNMRNSIVPEVVPSFLELLSSLPPEEVSTCLENEKRKLRSRRQKAQREREKAQEELEQINRTEHFIQLLSQGK